MGNSLKLPSTVRISNLDQMQGLRREPKCCLILIFQIEEVGYPFIGHVPNLLACRLRFKTLTAPVRPRDAAKISNADEELKEINLGLRHRLNRVPKYT